MKILHVIASLSAETGGPAKTILEMAAIVAGRGHDVSIFTTDQHGEMVSLDRAQQAGVEVKVPPVKAPRMWARSPALTDGRIVLFLVRLNFKKGLDILIPAFVRAAETDDSLRLAWSGPMAAKNIKRVIGCGNMGSMVEQFLSAC